MGRFNYPPNEGQDDGFSGDEPMDEIPLSGEDLHIAAEDIAEAEAIREAAAEEGQAHGDVENLIAEKDIQLAEMNDRVLRLAAEVENTRRRYEREKQDAARYAISEFARDLVAVADNFDRALRTVPEDTNEISPDNVEGLVTGLRMTEKELLSVLQRFNVNRVFPTGERFDPNLHQAVAQVPGNGIPTGHVVDVVQPGFTIGDRVLRAAMVTVSLGGDAPAPEPAPEPEEPEAE